MTGQRPSESASAEDFAALLAIEKRRRRRASLSRVLIALAVVVAAVVAGALTIGYLLQRDTDDADAALRTSERTVTLPDRIPGLVRRDEIAASDLASFYARRFEAATNVQVGLFRSQQTHRAELLAVVYAADPSDKLGRLMLSADDPTLLLDGLMLDVRIEDLTRPSPGEFGGTEECGRVTEQGVTLPMCAWTDGDTFGLILWLHRSVTPTDAVEVSQQLRAAAEHWR